MAVGDDLRRALREALASGEDLAAISRDIADELGAAGQQVADALLDALAASEPTRRTRKRSAPRPKGRQPARTRKRPRTLPAIEPVYEPTPEDTRDPQPRMVRIAGGLGVGQGDHRATFSTAADAIEVAEDIAGRATGGDLRAWSAYWAVFRRRGERDEDAMRELGRRLTPPGRRKPTRVRLRDWDALSERQRRRYLGSTRLRRLATTAFPGQGADEAVQLWYVAGGPLAAGRGLVGGAEHPGRGIGLTEDQWREWLDTLHADVGEMRRPAAVAGGGYEYLLFIGGGRRRHPERGAPGSDRRAEYNARRRARRALQRERDGKPYRPRR